ncbi:hypothetical protein ACHWQZ_G018759 [Mnemiopsis leidyi]
MNISQVLIGFQILVQLFLKTESQSADICIEAETCSSCLRTHFSCQWCRDINYVDSRCQSNSSSSAESFSLCSNWTFPVSSVAEVSHDFNSTVQVKPSRIKISNLRPGEEMNVSVTVKSSRDFPLDVYYLMDFSHSMKDDLTQLRKLSKEITDSLHEISPSYGIGLGTFVDKPTFPYAISEPGRIEMPCSDPPCQAVHSFRHVMNITHGTAANSDFTDKLNSVNISSNVDKPEGGFDAIVQVAVCSQIGWRDVSRRVILFASDATYHVAGDGILAGIIRPNRAQCGMGEGNEYVESLNEDYPSIGQLNKVLIEQQIIPIFAVTGEVLEDYLHLSNRLVQLSSVGQLSSTSDDIVELIKERLEDIVKNTQLSPDNPPEVQVIVTPFCSGNQVPTENGRGCSNVSMEEEVSFTITVRVDQCNEEGDNNYNFNIEVPGISKIPVSISLTCDCPCEEEKNVSRNSPLCLGVGDLVCGACQCHQEEGEEGGGGDCRDSADCGGAESGTCICGECDCQEGIYGDHCECSNTTCPVGENGELCSGNGNCSCGECICHKNNGEALFTGDECGCTVSKQRCMLGDLECSVYKTCPPIPHSYDVSCDLNFHILYTDYGLVKQRTLDMILIDRLLDCPKPPNIVAIVAGSVGGILAIGALLLVLYKVYISTLDKREYEKFLNERSRAKWNSAYSPVYKTPTTIYTNPLFTAPSDVDFKAK